MWARMKRGKEGKRREKEGEKEKEKKRREERKKERRKSIEAWMLSEAVGVGSERYKDSC